MTIDCARLLAVGYLYSYFWVSASGIYLLLRRDVDDTELDVRFLSDVTSVDWLGHEEEMGGRFEVVPSGDRTLSCFSGMGLSSVIDAPGLPARLRASALPPPR